MKKMSHYTLHLLSLTIILVLNMSFRFVSAAYAAPSFQTHSTWFEPIPADHGVHYSSSDYMAHVAYDFGAGTAFHYLGFSRDIWSVPIYYADPNTPTYDFGVTGTSHMNIVEDSIDQFGWNTNVPIPDHAIPASGADGHMVIVSADGNSAWDFYRTNIPQTGIQDQPTPTANRIKKWDLTSDGVASPYPRPLMISENLGGARVANTPLLHGLVTYDELDNAITNGGEINHALAFAYGGPPGAPPASRDYGPKWGPVDTTNSGPDFPFAPILGHRYQLDPTLDLDASTFGPSGDQSLSNGEKVVARALQKYGMIFVENNGAQEKGLYFEDLEHDTGRAWGDLNITSARNLALSDFYLIDGPLYLGPEPLTGSATNDIYIDFNDAALAPVGNWNTLGSSALGTTLSSLVDSTGAVTSVSVEVTDQFEDSSADPGNAWTDAGKPWIDFNAQSDSFFLKHEAPSVGFREATGAIEISGLDDLKTYQVEVVAARNSNSGSRIGEYTVNGIDSDYGKSTYFSAYAGGNLAHHTMVWSGLTTTGGTITIAVDSTVTAGYGNFSYLNAVRISEFTLDNADFNGDGNVDGSDFLAWQRGFGTGSTLAEGDANNDGVVNLDDLAIWESQFGSPPPALAAASHSASQAVPEPAGVIMLVIGLCCLLHRRPVAHRQAETDSIPAIDCCSKRRSDLAW